MPFPKNAILAGLAAAAMSLGFSAAASAQATHERVETRRVVKTTVVHSNMGRDEQMRHHGWTKRRVCNTRWVNHRKIRTCRTIRVRR